MLRHVVLFKFKEGSSQESISTIITTFLNLKYKNIGVIAIEWGKNISPENLHQGFTHCFTLTFPSLDVLSTYQEHPEHLKFQTILKPHMEKVFVVDYQAG